jgi:putative flippase GtrA
MSSATLAATFVRSAAASLIVFGIELALVALLAAAGASPTLYFAAVQIVGTIITFLLNKYWAFGAASTGRGYFEGVKSCVVFVGSFVLNIVLPLIALHAQLSPVLAFTTSQIVVGIAWTFPLNRRWVFDAVPVRVIARSPDDGDARSRW